MDKDTRNKIQKATQAIRKLLEVEYAEQLEGTFDIRRDGALAEGPGAHLSSEQRLVRDKLVAAVRHREAAGLKAAEAVAAWLREAAFTTLNRFVALKMLEARGLVQECVSKGDQSAGFKEFSGLAPGLVALPDKGYRLYIECLFDEIGREVKVLFDRLDPASLLWPRRTALTELLERLNAAELAGIWGEDETIGWVYQYFNGEDERKKMREESQAPRNSRELAVRNQFFTPRYVVQFLTDNTLGRMWYDMHQGDTKLKDLDYLVRRPTEVFLRDADTVRSPWVHAPARGDFSQLPEPDAIDLDALAEFSHLFDGYRHYERRPADRPLPLAPGHQGPTPETLDFAWAVAWKAAWERDGALPSSAEDLALLLFMTQRGDRWNQGLSEGFYVFWRAVYAAFRREVTRDDLSREEALKAPFFVPPRAYKDPRELRILDPACGSGHFLLYAFDLLLVIYEEAFEKKRLDGFEDLAAMRKALPELILRHNLHGVDIDPRAAQIAALALWMRAQRAWKDFGVARKDRPTITRTHIVVAEPMPGDKEMVDEFAATLKPAILGELFKTMVDKMTLAGELGSLLKIEEHLASAIEKARKAWKARRTEKKEFLPGLAPEARQPELVLDEVTDEAFFAEAEERILAALSEYASSASGALGVRRRLFAEDAAQGVALVELMRKRFDVVLMNPPFGDAVVASSEPLDSDLARCGRELAAAFVLRSSERWADTGEIGILLPTPTLFQPTGSSWRETHLVGDKRSVSTLVHLGGDVLDGATVSATAVASTHRSAKSVSLFIRALRDDSPRRAILGAVDAVRGHEFHPRAFSLAPSELRAFSGTPFTYWISARLRGRIGRLPKLTDGAAEVKQGTATADEFRFTRGWWEVLAQQIGASWIQFTKSSEYSPYWDDPTWVAKLADSAREIEATGKARVQAQHYFGRPGITFPSRSVLGFNPRAQPAGSAFSHTGAVVFPSSVDAATMLAFLASRPVEYLLSLYLGSLQGKAGYHPNHYEVGVIARLPWPALSYADLETLRELGKRAVLHCRASMSTDELTRDFLSPIEDFSAPLSLAISQAGRQNGQHMQGILIVRSATDNVVSGALGFSEFDEKEMVSEFSECIPPAKGPWRGMFGVEISNHIDFAESTAAVSSWVVGIAFGRFDYRLATGERPMPPEPEPFDPLPVCSPGMLTGSDGLPLASPPPNYAIDFPSDGILVDDPGHPRDLLARMRQVFDVIFKGDSDDRWRETAELMGYPGHDLRPWLRREFFEYHIKRYSKSRRKAPIYWQLATPSASYSVWVYIHRFSKDTLFKVLNDHVLPKLKREERRLTELTQDGGPSPTKSQREAVSDQAAFVDELRAFRDEVARVAPLWDPDLDDGVVINAAPLWRLFPQHKAWQKEVKGYWDDLVKGTYDWAHLAMHLWPERVVPACQKDRSFAIAHDLEAELWEEKADGKWQPRPVPAARIAELIAARTHPAVKAALKDLLDAPAPVATRARAPKAPRAPKPAPTAPTPDGGKARQDLDPDKRKAQPDLASDAGKAQPDLVSASTLAPEFALTATPTRTRRAAPSVDEATLTQVLTTLGAHPGGLTKAELVTRTGLPDDTCKAALDALLSSNRAHKSGAARGTRYHAGPGRPT